MLHFFKKKTQREKDISKLQAELSKYKKLHDFSSPRMQKRLFREAELEVISENRIKKIIEYEEKIEEILQKLIELYTEWNHYKLLREGTFMMKRLTVILSVFLLVGCSNNIEGATFLTHYAK